MFQLDARLKRKILATVSPIANMGLIIRPQSNEDTEPSAKTNLSSSVQEAQNKWTR